MEAVGGGHCIFRWMSMCDRRRYLLFSRRTVSK